MGDPKSTGLVAEDANVGIVEEERTRVPSYNAEMCKEHITTLTALICVSASVRRTGCL